MSLISRAHKQLQATKLKSLLMDCPLVLIYQTLGNVRSVELAAAVNDELKKSPGSRQLIAQSIKVKNTIASQANATALAPFFQANNILVGWSLTKPPKSSNPPSLGSTAAPVSPGAAILARRSDSLEGILGHLAAPPQGSVSDDPSHPPSSTSSSSSAGTSSSSAPSTSSLTTPSCLASSGSIPHKALTAAIDLGLKLPSSQPVALLAGFYRGQHFRQAHFKQWIGLDEARVVPELLSQIDSVAEGLCDITDAHLDQLLDTVDAMQPDDLIACLDAMAERREEEGGGLPAA